MTNEVNKKMDWMSIFIEKDQDKPNHVDYIFLCNVTAKDPRYKKRHMIVGQKRGLFRIDKATLNIELLLPMDGDDNNGRFNRAASKILKEYKNDGKFPKAAHFACG